MATHTKKPRPSQSSQVTNESDEEPMTAGIRENEQPDGEPITEEDHAGTSVGVSDSEDWESDDGLCEYERRRMRNIRENRALMASLNLLKAKEDFSAAGEVISAPDPPCTRKKNKTEGKCGRGSGALDTE